MSGRLRVHNLCMSVDGFGAGPDQSLADPLGVGAQALHAWIFETRAGRQMIGEGGGLEGVDDDFMRAGDEGIGATIMGRNMFGPIRGPWAGSDWSGWWGDEPPYHHPVFVLTHHARPPLEMAGGTVFHFVTEGLEVAYDWAMAAADGADVRLGGGVSTVQAYLRAGLVDEMHVAVVPVLLGAGERLFHHLGRDVAGYEVVGHVSSPSVTHLRLARADRTAGGASKASDG